MKNILVIQTAFIGDAILTLPMIEKLKEKYSGIAITVLCIPETNEIFINSPFVHETIIIDKKGDDRSIYKLIRFILEIRKRKFSKIYASHRSFRTALIVKFSGVKDSIGFSNSSFKEAYGSLVKYDSTKHEIQRNLDLIGYTYNNESWKIIPKIKQTSNFTKPLKKYFVNYNANSKLVVVAPGSVWETKKYPAKYYEDIINYLSTRNYFVLLIGGTKDKLLCEDLAAKFGKSVASAAGDFSIVESIELLKESEILICNDSAPTHMGMCADIPVLTIYCSTVSDFGFFPYNFKSKIASFDDLSCKPCGIHGYNKCPIKTFECAYKLIPEVVIKKIEDILNV
ncbi:MAG TPA: glycosyltransferase family 9 protein [Ignavibacteriaceae bacterium]|nr:glycosyltransferase family 9 protein [Ignavibacteriaceae bacterium]